MNRKKTNSALKIKIPFLLCKGLHLEVSECSFNDADMLYNELQECFSCINNNINSWNQYWGSTNESWANIIFKEQVSYNNIKNIILNSIQLSNLVEVKKFKYNKKQLYVIMKGKQSGISWLLFYNYKLKKCWDSQHLFYVKVLQIPKKHDNIFTYKKQK